MASSCCPITLLLSRASVAGLVRMRCWRRRRKGGDWVSKAEAELDVQIDTIGRQVVVGLTSHGPNLKKLCQRGSHKLGIDSCHHVDFRKSGLLYGLELLGHLQMFFAKQTIA